MLRIGYVLGALLLIAGALAPALAQQPFADVPLNHWAYNAVNSLAESGVLEGYPDGLFKGKSNLTRYEFAQAIARMMDRMQQMGGVPGPPGPPGPAGPAGPGAGAGLTPEQQALLDKLAKEFAPELKALRSDLDSLAKRVEDLEAAPAAAGPAITVSGSISTRVGLYGTELGVEDVEATGYPFAPFALAMEMYGDMEGMAVVPVSDGLKDAYKAGDFMTTKTRVNLSGPLADGVEVNVSLLAGPETNQLLRPEVTDDDVWVATPVWLTGNGLMDIVTVDQAWVKLKTRVLAPATLTVGKQYFRRGQGLLADNSQEGIKAVRVDWAGETLSLGAVSGMLDREQFLGHTASGVFDSETSGQDNYDLYYLDWDLPGDWALGANWLDSGYNEEAGWSASLEGKLYGLDFYSEYAKLTSWPNGDDWLDMVVENDQVDPGELELSESDTAWLTGLRWSNDAICLTAEYGEVDAGYAFAFAGGGWSTVPYGTYMVLYGDGEQPYYVPVLSDYFNLPLSALHPNAEVDPHDINWVDRPLFLDPTNIAKGWHVKMALPKLLGEKTPVTISYSDGDAYSMEYLAWLTYGGPTSGIVEPDKWRDADSVWTVKIARQLSDSVSTNIVYGRREAENVMAGVADADPIQVVRGEVCVAF